MLDTLSTASKGITFVSHNLDMDATDPSSTTLPLLQQSREDRLHHRRERDRARRAAETVEQKQDRLRKRRDRDRARQASVQAETLGEGKERPGCST